MSFKALSWAWEADTGSPGRKLVLVGLAQFANDKDECWPSQKTIAERTEQSERTVREHLAWLEEAGFLTRQARSAAGNRYDSDVIKLHLERLQPKAKEERKPAANSAAGDPPPENLADGEKPHVPAADFAGHQRQISPPNLHMNLQIESPTTPLPPKGGRGCGRKGQKKSIQVDEFDALIPIDFQTPPFLAKWHEFVAFRAEKKPFNEIAARNMLKMFSREARTPDVAITWIQKSLDQSWTGVFPTQVAPAKGFSRPAPRDTLNDELRAQLANRGRAYGRAADPIF